MDETALRDRLGIPRDAERVLVFGESSHWDPNWLQTSEEYYAARIWHVLDAVIDELCAEPSRVFAIECLFFLQMYWRRHPDKHRRLRDLVNQGRLRLTGAGITTPDTVLPDTEAILRDYLYGQQWLRDHGMTVEPRLAYLPDNFGHSPALPSIMRSLGFDMAAVTRIDGMYFVGTDYRLPSAYPLAGSSAERLQRELRTQAFVWQAPDGAEVLCHWNAFTYFQGDMLAHLGFVRWMGGVVGMPWRTGSHVARRIKGLVAQLQPLSRTPYMFCPVGCDFNEPIHRLVRLLDRYNETHYPDRGVWVLSAGMDDYLDLVACRRETLPVLRLDPNPYWMGFYASRPQAKALCKRITRKLTCAESAIAVASIVAAAQERSRPSSPTARAQRAVRRAWDLVVLSNHHDFITGTSPDRVWRDEQRPWLQQAESLADQALRATGQSAANGTDAQTRVVEGPQWHMRHGQIEVHTDNYALVLSEERGGCITSWRARGGPEALQAPANDVVSYRDTGGLWRMGHEFWGGFFHPAESSRRASAEASVRERPGLLEISVTSRLADRRLVRRIWLEQAVPHVRMRIEGAAAPRRTIVCRFPLALRASQLLMDVPGGVVSRPLRKLYDPTFWPARSFVHAVDGSGEWGVAVFLAGPACVSLDEDGQMRWVVLRNATAERVLGVFPVLAHPASGTDPEQHAVDYAVCLTDPTQHNCGYLARQARRALRPTWDSLASVQADTIGEMIAFDRDDVMLVVLKNADHGEGLIARLQALGPLPAEVRLKAKLGDPKQASLCDARERDIHTLDIDRGEVVVPLTAFTTSVRLRF